MNAWRLLRSGDLAGFGRRLLGRLRALASGGPPDYGEWRQAHVLLTDADRKRIAQLAATLPRRPSFTLVTPVGADTDPAMLRATLESAAAQLWPEWVLYLAADDGLDDGLAATVAAVGEPRIRVTGPAPAVLSDWAAWVPAGDLLHEACLFALAHVVTHAGADGDDIAVAYTDSDHVDAGGRHALPHCKPDWNPDLLAGQDYLGGLTAYRRDLLEAGTAGRAGDETAHERALRCTDGLAADRVAHVPHVLYSARTATASPADAMARTGSRQASHPTPDPLPKVSVLIPTRDQGRLLERCLASLVGPDAVTDYPEELIEVVLVDHDSTEERARRVIDGLAGSGSDPAHRVLPWSEPFNFAAMNNLAAEAATGDVLVLLNNDTEALSPGWLTEFATQLARPEVGIVGALLLFSDGTIQHAGVHPGVGGLMGHGHKHRRGSDPGYFGRLTVAHEVAAVTGACLGISRATWDRLGGLDAGHLAVAYNDVDLCLKARAAGLRVLFTPHAVLHHHESATRGFDDDPARNQRLAGEVAVMEDRWGDLLAADPAYSPNLALTGADFTLAEMPRETQPWRRSIDY